MNKKASRFISCVLLLSLSVFCIAPMAPKEVHAAQPNTRPKNGNHGQAPAPASSRPGKGGNMRPGVATPLPNLTAQQMALFQEGKALFEKHFMDNEGLGPRFNGRSCIECHHNPMINGVQTIGGFGAGYRSNLRFHNEPTDLTGTLFHEKAIRNLPLPPIPDASLISKRRPFTLLGAGMIDAISDEAILANQATSGGRAAMVDGQLFRFGSQAHVKSLFDFVVGALFAELGLTSPVHGFTSEPVNPDLPLNLQSRIPQPNVTMDTVQKMVDFIALLAPPVPATPATAQQVADIRSGEQIFRGIGCARCHVPTYQTRAVALPPGQMGPSPVVWPALLNKEIRPYSDFLLHNLGSTLDDGVTLGVARSFEYRTPPLWGVQSRHNILMHDGRANNLHHAILYHGGEAAGSRREYLSLNGANRHLLITFLESL